MTKCYDIITMESFDAYQEWTKSTDKSDGSLAYYGLGLAGETGEAVEHIKKSLRTGEFKKPVRAEDMAKELGDVLWYLARLSDKIGWSLSQIAQLNYDKLEARYKNA